jgi:ATP-dependent Clp protease adaptor protein ClpS
MVKHQDKPLEISQDDTGLRSVLILYNDDVNSFDFVVESLVKICKHDPEQAYQCALVAHFKGKCDVKNGSYHELKPPYEEMTFRGLTVSIE